MVISFGVVQEPENVVSVTPNPPEGATVKSVYVTRKVTVYGIQEQEIDSLSTLNTSMNVYLTLALTVLFFGLSPIVNAAFSDKLNDSGRLALYYVTPLCALISLGFFFMCWHASATRASTWKRIKDQSTHVG